MAEQDVDLYKIDCITYTATIIVTEKLGIEITNKPRRSLSD